MNNQIKRVAELENEIEILNHDREHLQSENTELIKEIEKLRRRLSPAAAAPQALTESIQRQIRESVKGEVENFSRQFRDDVVKDVSNGILPYVKTAHDLCNKTTERQSALEERLENHRAEIENSFIEETVKISELIDKLSEQVAKTHQTGISRWTNSYKKIEADLSAVNDLASSMKKNISHASQAYSASTEAAKHLSQLFLRLKHECKEAADKIEPARNLLEESVNTSAGRIESRFEDSRRSFKRTAYFVGGILGVCLIAFTFMTAGMMSFGFNMAADQKVSEVSALIEKEKIEIGDILKKTIVEAQDEQISNEAKIELWDTMLQTLNAQQRNIFVSNLSSRIGQLKNYRNDRKPQLAQKPSGKR